MMHQLQDESCDSTGVKEGFVTHGSKPHTRSKISKISQWQECFSELKISNPRISCTLNGVRRSS